jgi:fermentation-respiration switch protein FrsA (DUF1100 family)
MSLKHVLWTLTPVWNRTAPFWRRSWKHQAGRVALVSLYAYLGAILAMLALEDRLLYAACPAADEWLPPPAGVAVEDVTLTTADGTPVHAWWSPPPGWKPTDGALLFCHGNGGNLSHRGWMLPRLHAGLGTAVLLFDYPGYGRSGGSPSEAGCYAAGDAAYDWLTGVRGVPGERVVLYGGSLGGGTAVELARRRPHRALVLVSAFASFPDEAQDRFPWLPARWLVRNRFDNLRKLAECRGPVFVAHARDDGVISFAQGRELFAAAPGPKEFFLLSDWGHNDCLNDAGYAALRRFLSEHAPRPD